MNMKQMNKINIDVDKCIEELIERYSFNDVKKLYEALNTDIFKQELYKHMLNEFDEVELQCPHCIE